MTTTRTRPSMTRQHFDAIAQAIAGMQGVNLRERFARTLVPALQQFNQAFDEERFVRVATGGQRVRPRRRPEPAPTRIEVSAGAVSDGTSDPDDRHSVMLRDAGWVFTQAFNGRALTPHERDFIEWSHNPTGYYIQSRNVEFQPLVITAINRQRL